MFAARPGRALIPRVVLMAVVASLGGRARAADPQPYTVSIAKTGDAGLDAALSGSAQLVSLRKTAPAPPFALIGRAQQDVGRLQLALQSFGRYGATVAITIAGHPVDDPALASELAAVPGGQSVAVAVGITLGPLYRIGGVQLTGNVPPELRGTLGLTPGAPAIASDVLAAGGRLQTALQEHGYALAKVATPIATLDSAHATLDIAYAATTGPFVDIGAIHLAGLGRVRAGFIRRRLLVHTGQEFQPSKIEAARQDLASIGVFASVQARPGASLQPNGELPLDFVFAERPRHVVGITAAYSTDLGGSLGVTWSDRDVFGEAEQLNLGAVATGLGGNATQGLGYDVTAQFLKPDFLRRDQQFEADLGALKQNLDAYDQTAFTAGVSLSRKFSRYWTGSVGLSGEQEQIIQEGVTRNYTLAAIPFTAKYDSTQLSNPLDDPLHGIRANLIATPTESLGGSDGDAFFTILQGTASTYLDVARIGLTKPGHTVIALRALVGSAQGAAEFELPPDQRFYGGGSATVRGFRYQSVSPLFPDGKPIGGASIDAATVELRQRVYGPVGIAAFADAGQVGAQSAPFEGPLRVGIGLGARYYTPIGPIRLDIAVPVNRPTGPDTDAYEIYIGLGQAF